MPELNLDERVTPQQTTAQDARVPHQGGTWWMLTAGCPSSSAHLGPPTEHGRAEAEKVCHLSLDSMAFGSSLH
eukprot:7100075-Prymnesium_polylepis.1